MHRKLCIMSCSVVCGRLSCVSGINTCYVSWSFMVVRMHIKNMVAWCCCLLFLMTGEAYGKSTAVHTFIEQKKQVASSLLHQQLYNEATDAFLSILRDDPDSDEVNVGILIAAYNAKRYSHALLACERLLSKYPNDSGLRLQLARIYVALGESESARRALEQVKKIEPELTDAGIERLISGLESQKSRWSVNGTLTVGYIYDSNSNAGPSSDKVTLGRFADLRIPGAKSTETQAYFTAIAVDMGYRLVEDGPWWWVGDVGGYQRWNTTAGILYNKSLTWGRAASGLRYLGAKGMWELRLKGEEIYQEHAKDPEQTVLTYGMELTAARSLTEKWHVFGRFGLEDRHFSESKLQNGQYWNVGGYTRYFFGEANHEITAGFQLSGGQAANSAYSYSAAEPSIRALIHLPYDTYLTSHVLLRHEDYKGPATGLEVEERMDNHWRLGVGLGWDITESLALNVQYEYIKNYSNSEFYQYKQDLVTTSMAFKF